MLPMIREEVKSCPNNTRGAWSLPENQKYKTKPLLGSLRNLHPIQSSKTENVLGGINAIDFVRNQDTNNLNITSPNSSPKVVSHKWLRKHLTLLPSKDDGRLKVERYTSSTMIFLCIIRDQVIKLTFFVNEL